DVGLLQQVVGPSVRLLSGDVDADLGHQRDRRGVQGRGRFGARGPGPGAVAGELTKPAQRHLGASGVVHAEEEDTRTLVGSAHVGSCESWGRTRSLAGIPGKRKRPSATAASAPSTCMTMNMGTLLGAMPAKVSLSMR